ncbi:MAG TPA: DMT family transporter, partial [Plasticicumulans sp.]|nr:DMT family transporter [Plasticicumulans sp.]
ALGGLVVLPLALRADPRPSARPLAPRAALAAALLAGLVLFGGVTLQQIGLQYTSIANAGFITGLYVVLVPLLGLLTGQRAPAVVWIGAGLAVIGLFLLSVRGDFTVAAGDWLQLAGALCWAVHVLLIDALAPRTHALRLACRQFFACAAASLIAALLFEPIEWAGIVAAAPAIAWGGLLSVGTGYTLQVIAQQDAPAAHAALLMSLEAVFAALAGWWWLGEGLDARALAGCTLMLAGMLLAQGLAGGGRPAGG